MTSEPASATGEAMHRRSAESDGEVSWHDVNTELFGEDDEEEGFDDEKAKGGSHGPTYTADNLEADEEQVLESFAQVANVHVQVRQLSLDIKNESFVSAMLHMLGMNRDKPAPYTRILNNVSMDAAPGQVMAILGGSGSGKTSLLNAMADRVQSANCNMTGDILFNGEPLSRSISRAYVIQQDILLQSLTVRETLRYSADLRLDLSRQARRQLVEEVIMELSLKDCADTVIGSPLSPGCSGGEKRRVSIGVQLLANPSVLFLDEVTTGLDSFTAHQIILTIKKLARRGRTIITTIHQPRSDIFFLFDAITILSQGNVVFSGTPERAVSHFEAQGYPFPAFTNPADHLIDVSAIDLRDPLSEEESRTRVGRLVETWRDNPYNPARQDIYRVPSATVHGAFSQGASVPWTRSVWTLTKRGCLTAVRDPFSLFGTVFEAVLMATVAGWIFWKPGGSQSGIRTITGSLYSALGLQNYIVLIYSLYRITTAEIAVFDRERNDGMYGVVPFVLGYRASHLIMEDVIVPFVFSVIFYFMVHLRTDGAQHFFVFFMFVFLSHMVSVALALMSVAASRSFATASLISNSFVTFISLSCGYFIQSNVIPIYLRWIKWISYIYYSFAGLCSNEFSYNFYDCPYGGPDDARCEEYTGAYILSSLGFTQHYLWRPAIGTIGFFFAYMAVALLLLRYNRVMVGAASKKSGTFRQYDRSGKANDMNPDERGQIDPQIALTIRDYRLDIFKPLRVGQTRRHLHILRGVSADFAAGKVNAILGPSGSGKSTLLSSLCGRLHNSFATRYSITGSVRYNGQSMDDMALVRTFTSYVTQDEGTLLPSLTVRETLYFAAELRLAGSLSKAEKHARAEDVILKLGLKECADTIIGSEFIKGISGGERRRVSIAMQILAEPHVLLLDEPTSGLDANLAHSLMGLLASLARQGRTVVCTIHQSRSDLFGMFDNVLLLAKGGHTVYSGPSKGMLDYFSQRGYDCPIMTNPTDYVMDLCSINVQRADREAVSRKRVSWLINEFGRANTISNHSETAGHRLTRGGFDSKRKSTLTALPVLLRRSVLNFKRQPLLLVGRVGQGLSFAIICALFSAPLRNNYYYVQTRMGMAQEFTALLFIGMLNNIGVYPAERDVFYREYDDGAYPLEAFVISYTAMEVPFEIISGIVFSLFMNPIAGMKRTVDMFFLVMYVVFCFINVGESIGIAFNCIFGHQGLAVIITSVVLSLGTTMAGVMSTHMPPVLHAINYISPFKYGIGAVIVEQMSGLKFHCTEEQLLSNGECPITTGEQALEAYRLNVDRNTYLWALAVSTVAYRFLAYVFLRLRKLDYGSLHARLQRRGPRGDMV